MLIAVIGDTHAGCKSDARSYYDHMKKFYDEIFFPAIEEYGITNIIHLGDILDRRKFVNFVTLDRLWKDFILPIEQRGLTMDLIIGNHDTSMKNTNEINSPELLFRNQPNMNIYTNPIKKEYDGLEIGLIPWICEENKKRTLDFLRRTSAPVIFGHFELSGFNFSKHVVADHGMNPQLLSKFDVVGSGHYHHKSSKGNIHYLGNPFQMDWGDYAELRGFNIFDTDTRQFEFIPNPFDMYIKYFYDDTDMSIEQLLDFDKSQYSGKYVKIVVKQKNNPAMFDLVYDAIQQTGPIELNAVDDHLNMDQVSDETIIEITEDTIESLNNYVDSFKIGVDKAKLKRKLHELYIEAQHSS